MCGFTKGRSVKSHKPFEGYRFLHFANTMGGQQNCLIRSLELLLFLNPKVTPGFLQKRKKLRQEKSKCHQHRDNESIKPALEAGGLDHWRGEVWRGGGFAERGDQSEAAGNRSSHQSAEAATEWLPSLAACIPLKASDAGMSQLWGDRGVLPACCHPCPAT